MRYLFSLALCCLFVSAASAADGNRLTYLDEFCDPYYPHRAFPKLITPQWVGDKDVECVVVLAIDDMRDPEKYETFLRPILDRLKQIDGRAPVSIMTNQVDPKHERLQQWLKEGLSLEVHTFDHPCPCLAGGDFNKAKQTFEKCVDLLNEVPGNVPVAFRMPCCDSLNTPSPRFWMEIFNKTTEKNNCLTIDSSVFNIITSKDTTLPKEITLNEQGEERFRRYVPFPSFVNTIENYPYPYVIGKLCWQFPCVVPSDWSAQHVQKPNNPDTVRDLKLALDACVIKQGVYNLVFHPHGWIRNDQIVELIDHAVSKHGKKVKFLNFRECDQRLKKNLLAGQSLRSPLAPREDTSVGDNGVRILDANGDGYMDVVIGNAALQRTRIWDPREKKWLEGEFPDNFDPRGPRFGILTKDGRAGFIANDSKAYLLSGADWVEGAEFRDGLPSRAITGYVGQTPRDRGLRLRDLDHDGICEAIFGDWPNASYLVWDAEGRHWSRNSISFPENVVIVSQGYDVGLRFIDIDADDDDDIVYSNYAYYGVYLFDAKKQGWTTVRTGAAKDGLPWPAIVRDATTKETFFESPTTNNGTWFHSNHLWWQNEDTQRLPDHVDRRSFAQLLGQDDTNPKRERGPDSAADKAPTITPTDRSAAPGKEATEENLKEFPPAKSPEDALKSMSLAKGLKIELVAAEPLIVDPVAFDWGPDGRLWVVEMRDYPRGIDDQGNPGGRVKVLTDKDGDGMYDEAKVFLDNLPFPTGLKVWRKGIIVTAAPEVIYAEDTNGDDVADEKQTLYRGFAEGNQQHRVNGLRYGLDGWLYLGNGDSGGKIKSQKTDAEVSISGRDLRIHPESGQLDAISGQTQYSLCFDDTGNRFGGNNSQPLWHYVLEDYYLRRNPNVIPPAVRHIVPKVPGNAPIFPTSKTITRFNDYHTANRFTSACGIEIYRDTLLGEGLYGNSFVCEPVHNLIHREVLSAEGASFSSRRVDDEAQSEFLSSSDNWFRPVMARTGPDGALYVADMYRLVIEHPTWIPVDWQQKLDLRAGSDKGRIYRVVPSDKPVPRLTPLDKLTTPELVAAMDSGSGTRRDMVQQQLVWRQDPAAIEPLRKLASTAKPPLVRMQALCTLGLLEGLTPELIQAGLKDTSPAVRKQSIRLSEGLLKEHPKLGIALAELVDHQDPQVVLQLACTLGELPNQEGGKALARLMEGHPHDARLRGAVMSSIQGHNLGGFLATQTNRKSFSFEHLTLLTLAIDSREYAAVAQVVGQLGSNEIELNLRLEYLAWILDRLERQMWPNARFVDAAGKDAITALFAAADEALQRADAKPELRLAAVKLLAQEVAARRIVPIPPSLRLMQTLATEDKDKAVRLAAVKALDARNSENATLLTKIATSDEEVQQAALESLAHAPGAAPYLRSILEDLQPTAPPEFQAALIRALGASQDREMLNTLLTGWRGRTPLAREQILDSICGTQDGIDLLIDALRRGVIPPSQIGNKYRRLLLNHPIDKQRTQAEKLFAGVVATDRVQLLSAHQDVLTMTTDIDRGKQIFAKKCAACHKHDGIGHAVGPELASLTAKSPGSLLTALLDPNRAVEDKFRDYLLISNDGKTFTGIITGETGTSITLLAAEGKEQTVLRKDIETLVASGKSLMPEGLERDLSKQELADVIAYVRQSVVQSKKFAGNEPRTIVANDSGVFELQASHARIYGPTLVFEPQYKNLGYWKSEEDHAQWTCRVAQGGKYRVKFDFACAHDAAGDKFILEIADFKITGVVANTGSWDEYRQFDAGELTLAAGDIEATLRSAGKVKSALIDLRAIRLEPVK